MRSPAEERGKRFGERVEGVDEILPQGRRQGTEIIGCMLGSTYRNSVRRHDGRHLTVVNICLQLPNASRKIAWRASTTVSNTSDHLPHWLAELASSHLRCHRQNTRKTRQLHPTRVGLNAGAEKRGVCDPKRVYHEALRQEVTTWRGKGTRTSKRNPWREKHRLATITVFPAWWHRRVLSRALRTCFWIPTSRETYSKRTCKRG